MREILKIMRFDFLTAKPLALAAMIFTVLLFGTLSMLFAPLIAAYITFVSMIFVIPLQGVADKSGFHKLYGILPVKRKNITRARFLYIFLIHFLSEMLEFVIAGASIACKLYRFLPNQNSELMIMVRDSFADTRLTLLTIIVIFTALCLLFSYMEMMGQIHGRENEFMIIMITIGVLALIAFVFIMLTEHDLIPAVRLPSLPSRASDILKFGAVLNVIMLGICQLFGEITAGRLAKREL